jgi:hypothetical protein
MFHIHFSFFMYMYTFVKHNIPFSNLKPYEHFQSFDSFLN